jgi:uncharacterized protein (DUF302 family)
MAEPKQTRSTREVEHITITSTRSFEETKAALERLLPELDPGVFILVGHGDTAHALKELENGPPLSRFLSRDHGALLRIAQQPRKAVQYDIGNPLTASRMTHHQLAAALYAPLRVLLYENAAGIAVFEYDRPSSSFGQFGDTRVAAVARELDAELEGVLVKAAS